MRTTVLQTPASHRPSIELARRGIAAIARQMEISSDLVEMATAIYKLGVNVNAVSGARTSILCACLYAVCRREGTTHMLYDFADAAKESPLVILHYMKLVCRATNTAVPPLDSSMLLFRLAEHLRLGDEQLTQNVCICALKVLRMMQDSWIHQGRRPLGLCAAALIVACDFFKVSVDPREICAFVRLTGSTLQKRLIEYWNTPAAKLESVDDYDPSAVEAQLPQSFTAAFHTDETVSYKHELLDLSRVYYELISEAKVSTPPTPERCEKWKTFVTNHCRINKLEVKEELMDLTLLTPQEQLIRLGFPHAVPVPFETASQVKSDVTKLGFLRAAAEPQLGILSGKKKGHLSEAGSIRSASEATDGRATVKTQATQRARVADGKGEVVADETPFVPMTQQLDLMEAYLSHHNEDELGELDDFMRSPILVGAEPVSKTEPQQENDDDDDDAGDDQGDAAEEVADCRPHALPWEAIVLPPLREDSMAEVEDYIVFDLEQRLRSEKVLEERLGKQALLRGRGSTPAQVVARLRHGNGTKRRRLERSATAPAAAATLQTALERALKGRGASAIDVSGLDALIPGLGGGPGGGANHDPSEVGSSVNDEWPVD